MPFRIEIIDMDKDAKRIMPISMEQKYHSGERLEALIKLSTGTNTTILIADYLHRHNTEDEAAALKKGTKFLRKNVRFFKDTIPIETLEDWDKYKDALVVKVVRWKTWGIIKKTELIAAQKTIEAGSSEKSSINYQREENAYLLTFTDFAYYIYPRSLNDSQLEIYKQFGLQYKLPKHAIPRFVNIEVEGALSRGMWSQKPKLEKEAKDSVAKKQQRSMHLALRMALRNIEMALSDPDIPLEEKKIFIKECNCILISLGLSFSSTQDQSISSSTVDASL